MKKFVSLVLSLILIITSVLSVPVYSAESIVNTAGSYSISTDFEGYTGSADYTHNSLLSYMGTLGNKCIGSQNFASGTIGITNAQTDRGTSLNLLNYGAYNAGAYATLNIQPPADFDTAFQIKLSLKTTDTERPRAIRHGNKSNCVMLMLNDSKLTLMGNVTKFTWEKDKWYDIDIKVNLKTGYYQASAYCNGITDSFEGIHSDIKSYGKYEYTQLTYYGNNKENSTTKNNTYIDDITICEIEPIYKSIISEVDFNSFSGSVDGVTVPEGFTASGTASNENGFYADNGKLKVVTSNTTPLILKKSLADGLAASAYGTMRVMADLNLSDKNADRSFMIGNVEVLKFLSGGNAEAGINSAAYETGKDYKVSIKIDTSKNEITSEIKDGDVVLLSGTTTVTAADLTDISFKIVQTLSSSEAFIDNFNIYSDNGLILTNSNPASGSKNIKPCDVSVLFSNPLASVGYATLNGEAVPWNIASNKIVLSTASMMDYGQGYTLTLGSVTDIFGGSKDYTLNFSTIAAKTLSEISITSDGNITASVTGVANDGNTYGYTLILAQFNASNNMLLNIASNEFVLSDASTSYTASLACSSDAYYEAYLWDDISTMNAVCDKASFGAEPFSAVSPGETGFKENMDTGVVTGTNLGISNSSSSTLIIFKPGKDADDILTASKLTDVIDFIKQFDKKADDVFSYTPSAGNGLYSYTLDGQYTSDGFNYIDPIYVEMVYDEINSDGASFIECINNYNDILGCDISELSGFSDGEKSELEQLIYDARQARPNGFDTIASFQDAYYSAVAFVLIKYSDTSADVKAAIEKYGSYLDIDKFTAYKTFSESNDTAKAEVYSAIASAAMEDKDSLEKIDELFSSNSVLYGIRNSYEQIQIGNILNDNNDTILHFDFSKYNKITNKSALHSKLIGIQVSDLVDFKNAFDSAVAARLEEEANEKDVSEGITPSGNTVIYDFEGYVGNDETLSITTLSSWKTGWSSYGLAEGLAGPTSVKTDRGTSVNLINRAGNEQYSNAVLRPIAKSDIETSAEIRLSMQFKDLNRPTVMFIYDGKGKDMRPVFVQGTDISLFGNKLTMKAEIDKWYDFTIRLNKISGYYEASVLCNGDIESVSGVSESVTNLAIIDYIGFGYIGNRTSGTVSSIWYDDLIIKEIDPLYVSYVDESDLDSFTQGAGGTKVPDGFTASGIVSGVNGFYTSEGKLNMKTSQEGELTLKKQYDFPGGYNADAFGTVKTNIEITPLDKSAERIIKIGDCEIACFTSDGNFTVGEATTTYDANTSYTITIKADSQKRTDDKGESYYNLITVLLSDGNGKSFNATKKVPVGNITSTSIVIFQTGSSSQTLVNTFDVYNDNGFYIADSSPYAYQTDVIPCDAKIVFSNYLKNVASVTLNNTSVSFSIKNNNELLINSKSKLQYNTKNIINILGAEDIFGNKKDFKLTFYTGFASKLSDITINSGADISASVSGSSYDGNKYKYILALAKFDSNSNKLLDIKTTNISLDDKTKEFSVNISKSEGAYYEAYVWDSIKGMVAIKDKATLGTNALSSAAKGKDGYIQNMDNLVLTATNTGIPGEGRNTLLIFKPGKNMSHIAGASNLTDVIDFISQFDNKIEDVYAYTPSNGAGSYGVAINGVYKANAFTYIGAERISDAFDAINSDGAGFVDNIGLYNDVFGLDVTELSGFDTSEKARLDVIILEEKQKLANGFETTVQFKNAYNKAVSRVVLENAQNSGDVKLALEKYGNELGIKDFVAYSDYIKLSQQGKEAIYADIAATADLSDLTKIEDAFAKAAILRGVQYADNYVEISNIINNNNAYLKFDVSTYNSMAKKSDVNRALIGNYYGNIPALKTAFNNAVLTYASSNNPGGSQGSGVSGGSVSSNVVTLGPVPTQGSGTAFSDLSGYQWAKEAIEYLAQENIVSGKAEGIFDPGANITREEFTKIIVNAFIGIDETLECTFADVNKGEWYYYYVATAQKLGIINGTSSSTFGVGEKITRQDMAAILYRAAKMCGMTLQNGSVSFDDAPSISDYAKEAVGVLSSSGIINGKGNNLFEPLSFATRAECAKMIYGLIERGEN